MAILAVNGEHAIRGAIILTTLGFLNVAASLVIILFYSPWGLDLLRKKKTFMTWLVLYCSILQLFQDVAIGYHFLCPLLVTWDDDMPWVSRRVPGFDCNASEWFIEDLSGLLLQSSCLYMAGVVFYIVVFERTFDTTKWMIIYLSFWFCVSLIFACWDVFGSYKCDGDVRLWPCPNVGDPSKFSVGYVGWQGSESIRTAQALLAVIFIGIAAGIARQKSRHKDAVKDAIYQSLLKRCMLYPLAQSFCRIPSLYIYWHGGLTAVDGNEHEEGLEASTAASRQTTRLAGFYIMILLTPMGGIFSLAIFLYVNHAARDLVVLWFHRVRQMLGLLQSSSDSPHAAADADAQTDDAAAAAAAGTGQTKRKTIIHHLDEDALISRIVRRISRIHLPNLNLNPHLNETNNPLASPALVSAAKRVSFGATSATRDEIIDDDEDEDEEAKEGATG